MSVRGKKRSLAEQLAELSNPKPVIFNPEGNIDNTPKICEFDEYEAETDAFSSSNSPVKRRRRGATVLEVEEDVRYAGKAISRKDLEQLEEGELFVECVFKCFILLCANVIMTSAKFCVMLVMHSWHGLSHVTSLFYKHHLWFSVIIASLSEQISEDLLQTPPCYQNSLW